MVTVEHVGNFEKTLDFLRRMKNRKFYQALEKYGAIGVAALASATPKDSGQTANCWDYKINTGSNQASIEWINTNRNDGVNIAIILQYGHGTGTGGYVQGRDYINPAIAPVFDKILSDVWNEVIK